MTAVINFSGVEFHSTLGRLLRFPLRFIPENAVLPVLQGPLLGTKWIAGSSNHGCWLGSYERDKQLEFSKHLKKGDVVYDIGANVGFYTLLSSRLVGPQGKVYAFEPLPRNLDLLRRHLSLNAISNVEVLDLAVSDEQGISAFDPSAGNSQGCLAAGGALSVNTDSLDNLRPSLRDPTCLKIDVEGAEASVLRGARQLLAERKPTLFLATHGEAVHRECVQLLDELGYQVVGVSGAPVAETDEIIAVCRDLVPG